MSAATSRGPLAPLAGVPGLFAALGRAAAVALLFTAGTVALAAGLASGVADVAAEQVPGASLAWARAGVLVRALASWGGDVLAARDGRRGEDALRARVLRRLFDGEGEAVEAAGGGPAAVLAGTRLHELGRALATVVPALAQVVVPPLLLVVLGFTDPLSALLVGITLPLVPLFMALVGLHTRDRTRAATRALDRIAEHVAELTRGLPVLVGLGRAGDQLSALRRLGEAHRTRTLATLRLAFLSSVVLEVLATLSVALVAVTVGVRLVGGGMSLQVGLLALLLAPEAFAPLRALGAAHHAAEAVAAARAVLDTPPARAVVIAGATLSATGLSVCFTGRTRPAVDGLDLRVDRGEVLALRGASGCGKSTVLAVLAGALQDGTRTRVSGTISVPGEVGGGGGQVALVPQHPRTTADTVSGELLAHGAQPAEVPELLAAVGATGLLERRCRTLSPGELARVALARARALVRVRRGAGVLLLDEPTASLDADSVDLVVAVVAQVREQVAIVLVTHDDALAALADRAIKLSAPARASAVRTAVPAPGPEVEPEVEPGVGAEVDRDPAPSTTAEGAGEHPEPLAWPRRALGRAVAAGVASAATGVALTATSGWLIVRASERPAVLTLLVAIVAVRASGLARAGLRWLERLAEHDAALTLAAGTRVGVWAALAAQGLAADRTPGRALARVVGDVALLQELTVRVLTPVRVAAVVLSAAGVVLVLLDPSAGAAAVALLTLAVLGVVLVHRRADAGPARTADTLRTATLQGSATALEGAADLRAHGLRRRRARPARSRSGPGRAARRRCRRQSRCHRGGGHRCGRGGRPGAAGAAVRAGTVTAPVAAVLALTPLALLDVVLGLGGALRNRASLTDAQTRLEAVLAEPVAPDPEPGRALPRPVRSLAAVGLRVGWPGGPDVLTDLDVAVVRGADVREVVAWCPQDAHVFAASIRANLALAAPATDDTRMHTVLDEVGLSGLLATLPAGLDTGVGSGGTALSGGERRRLAVARALLADRDVVLLDEPTAHLDPPTAAALVADLRRGLADRVVVCVTHDRTPADAGDTVLDLAGASLVAA